MKAFQLKISTLLATIVMLSGVILFGCSDRDNSKAIEELIPNMNLSPEVLDQTVWKGEVIDYYEGKESNRYLITLFFRAGNRVSCYSSFLPFRKKTTSPALKNKFTSSV